MKIILTVLTSVIKSFGAKVWGKLSVAGGGKDNYSHKASVDRSRPCLSTGLHTSWAKMKPLFLHPYISSRWWQKGNGGRRSG